MRRAHQFANAGYAAELGNNEITGVQFIALIAIREEPGLSGVGVADHIGYDKMTTSRVLRVLEKKGFIRRKASKTDGRETSIFCTPAGERVAAFVSGRLPAIAEHVLKPLTKEESQQLLALLDKLEISARRKGFAVMPSSPERD